MSTYQQRIRQGLPRTPGGPAWPNVEGAVVASSAVAATGGAAAGSVETVAATAVAAKPEAPAAAAVSEVVAPAVAEVAPAAAAAAAPPVAAQPSGDLVETPLRRGLPRTPGGEPWPPDGVALIPARATVPAADSTAAEVTPVAAAPVVAATTAADLATTVAEPAAAAAPMEAAAPEAAEILVDAAATPAAVATQPAAAPAAQAAPTPEAPAKQARAPREPKMIGSRTLGQWVKLGVLGVVGAIVAAGIIVLAARGVTTLPGVPEFLERYPGEYHLPEFVEDGFPWWARWAHFLNFFLMVLIIRSGLLVRQQQKPDAFFTPKKGGKKISIYLWLHTSLDVLWLLNGVIFVVLLFASGHWARIVPTSWEVFPNAASAMLQYLTLEWPVEDGWKNYNSLQQLMYFTVVFLAAPLAAITGVRMSEWWPEKAEKLNKIYPAPVARAIHFPTMLFFVLFILIHVFLVLSTGALKNLNHMFAGTPEISWVGFWWFAGGLLVTAAVTWAARPLVLAPIANLFGRVSER